VIAQFSTLSDEELTKKIKLNEEVSGCLAELQNRHSGIFFQRVNKFACFMEGRDLKENPMSLFYEAATSYDPSKSKFPTWLSKKTYWECCNQTKNQHDFVQIEDWNASESPKLGRDELYSYVQEHIQDEEDKIILIKRLEGYTLQEIADIFEGKYTYEWVRQKFNRQIERFKKILAEEMV
jgi:DNA-directed RNA polymerase specialized sigma24 family protein